MWHEARKQEKKIRGLMVDYKRRAERRREYYERIKLDPTQFLRVYGRPYRIHLDPAVAYLAESPQSMMPWNGQTETLIDRFDVRAHLDYIPDHTSHTAPELTSDEEEEERKCNYERYRMIVQNECTGVSEDQCLRQIYIDEQFGAIDIPKMDDKKKNSDKKAAIGYTYEDSTPAVQTKTEEEEEEQSLLSSDDDDEVIDLDVAVDVDALTDEQAKMLNICGTAFGMSAGDYVESLRVDKEEAEALRLAKLLEEEKAQFSGRKSRRERRAYKEKRLKGRAISPPSYAARESPKYEPVKRSPTRSRSPSPENAGQVQFITSFGKDSDDEDNKACVVQGPALPPHLQHGAHDNSNKSLSRRSRKKGRHHSRSSSRSTSRSRHRHRSYSRSRSRSPVRRKYRQTSSSSGSSRSKSRDRTHRHRYSRSRSRSRSRSKGRSRNRHRSRSRSRSKGKSRSRERSRTNDRSRSSDRKSHRSRSSSSRSSSSSSSRSRSRRSRSTSNSRSRSKSPTKGEALMKRYRRPSLESSGMSSDSDENDSKKSQSSLSDSRRFESSKIAGFTSTSAKQAKLTPQERLKRRMQVALNKQYKADKRAQVEKITKAEQERMDREEELRSMAILMRRREREKRHREQGDSSDDERVHKSETSDRSRRISEEQSTREDSKRGESRSSRSERDSHRSDRSSHRSERPDVTRRTSEGGRGNDRNQSDRRSYDSRSHGDGHSNRQARSDSGSYRRDRGQDRSTSPQRKIHRPERRRSRSRSPRGPKLVDY